MVGGQGAAWRVTRREGKGGLRPIIAHSTLDHCSHQPIGSKIRMEISCSIFTHSKILMSSFIRAEH